MQTDIYGSNFQTTQTGGTGTFNLNSGDVLVAGNVNVAAGATIPPQAKEEFLTLMDATVGRQLIRE